MTQAEFPKLTYPLSRDAPLEPPAEWAELRSRCPVAKITMPSGDEARLLTRYADVRQVLGDARFGRRSTGPDAARISEAGGVFDGDSVAVLPQTGEGHLLWRRMITKWFTVRRMTALRPAIEAMADQLIDGMVEQGPPADLRANLAFPLPVWVICDMLGVPDSDRDLFAHWSDSMLSLTRYTREEMDQAQQEFAEYMAAHVAARRREPGDDLLSELSVAVDGEGRAMTDPELIATGQGLLVAGHETTANMIGKMIAMLLADRQRWERLLADPSLVRPAVEETLRFDANLGFGMVRYIDEDIQVGDETITRGTTVVCDMASANRDETVFTDADDMDLSRNPNTHLTFGVGPHSCLGQSLARTELTATLDVLLRRLPSLELAVPARDLQQVEGLIVGGLSSVPVRW